MCISQQASLGWEEGGCKIWINCALSNIANVAIRFCEREAIHLNYE
jgi:hypothetical protein